MHTARSRPGRWAAAPLLALLPLTVGCSGSDRTGGTQVQVSKETEAQVQDMEQMYRDMAKEKTKTKARR